MSEFENPDDLQLRRDPPFGIGDKRYEITRCPEKGKLFATILSEFVLGKPTHWAGQTVPCGEDRGCDYCKREMAIDWHSYFFAYERETQVILLMEITRGPLQAFRSYEDTHGSLRGAVFFLTRKPQRSNGRVVADVRPSKNPGSFLPPCPDLNKVLKRIWSGGRISPAEKAQEILASMDQKTFAHDAPGVEQVVEETIRRVTKPSQQYLNRKEMEERYPILSNVAESVSLNGKSKKKG